MNTLFQPAIALLNHLRYPQKFALVSLFFLAPLTLLLYFFLIEVNSNIRFAVQELRGVGYLRALEHFLEHLPQHESLADAFLRQHTWATEHLPNEQARLDRVLEALLEVETRDGKALGVAEATHALRANHADLRQQLAQLTPEISADIHHKLTTDTLALMTQVGDNSNLILDPDLDTYYSMDAILLRLPESLTLLTALRQHIAQALEQKTLHPENQAQLIINAGLLENHLAKLRTGLGVAFAHNPAGGLKQALDGPLAQYVSALETLLRLVRETARNQTLTLDSAAFHSTAAAAVTANAFLWERTAQALEHLLQTRIQDDIWHRNLLLLVSFLAVLAVAYLWVGFYFSLMRTVAHLKAAALDTRTGNSQTYVVLENRDELAEAAEAFNAVTAMLHRNSEQFRSIVEHSVEGFFQTTLEGHYRAANPALARIYGYPNVADLITGLADIGRQLYLDPKRRDEFRRLIAEQGAITNFESEVRRKDGSTVWISESARLVSDETGQPLYYEGMVQDITAKVQAEEHLRQAKAAADAASHAKSEFLANMSHEIRTPMNAILGFSELLHGLIADPKQKSYLSAIISSGKTLLTLINDILDLSKIEAGKFDLEYSTVALPQVLQEIRHMFVQKAEQKDLELRLDLDANLPEGLLLDEVRIRQILINVVGNAVKFTEAGHVQISAYTEPHPTDPNRVQLILEVSDTGIGIPPDEQQRIFEAFTQQSGQSQRKFGGTGLGLSITRRLTDMMGGRISLHSEVGEGATFRFHFPEVAVTNATPAPSFVTPTPEDFSAFAPATILVVDDIAMNRDLIRCYFDNTDHRIIEAVNGQEALEQARTHRPDVILMDIRMPVIDGVQASRLLKADAQLRVIPIVVVTASAVKHEEEAVKPIVEGFLKKPVGQRELLQVLRRFLKARPVSDGAPPAEVIPPPSVEAEDCTAPELSALLEAELPRWQELYAAPILDEVQEFATQLTTLGQVHSCRRLMEYGRSLYQQAELIDMVHLPDTLERFAALVESLRRSP